MAHQLEHMAYVGDTPWHGLGQQLSPHQPLEVWRQQAGMDSAWFGQGASLMDRTLTSAMALVD
ncbi:hypothetical protein KG088_18690 [Halomonas sp. TRM85114]|uniref:hypothetical protein n=1 Tax=Halomonas jincaotanensis TaxID=2810616 RepID=UPI001BD3D74C|nr:hypothetical protein [Halomonas jincaotanensis]MBS9405620.1 hypothetical protein [Halomonas jincaotanensis]